MASIKLLAGDFAQNGTTGTYMTAALMLPEPGAWVSKKIYIINRDVVTLELADERSGVAVFGAAGWGAAGALAFGPLGLLAGAVLGGKKQRVAFVAKFRDGKHLMGECDKATWVRMKADHFGAEL